jgi:hypothetical protein
MTEQEALPRLQNRLEYLQKKIVEFEAIQKSTFWLLKDVEATEIAMAAVRYVIDLKAYEATQHKE